MGLRFLVKRIYTQHRCIHIDTHIGPPTSDGCVRWNHKNTMRKLSLVLSCLACCSVVISIFASLHSTSTRIHAHAHSVHSSREFYWKFSMAWVCPCIQIGCRKWGDAKVVYSFISSFFFFLFFHCSPQGTNVNFVLLLPFAENHSSVMSDTK